MKNVVFINLVYKISIITSNLLKNHLQTKVVINMINVTRK